MFFFPKKSYTFVLLRDLKNLKSFDKTALENFIFIRKKDAITFRQQLQIFIWITL